MDTELNATILARRDLSPRVALFQVRPDAGGVPNFDPGQFVQLGLPEVVPAKDGSGATRVRIQKRSYSIASSPAQTEAFEICIALVEEGRFTPQLWRLSAGDRCWLDARPMGQFTLERIPPERDLVLVATGTGIAPYVSMLRTWSSGERWRRVVVVHGVREVADLVYRDELERRAGDDDAAFYVPVVSRTVGAAWSGITGRVQAALEGARLSELCGVELDPTRCHALLCGNPAMIQDVRALLEARGFVADTARQLGSLRLERYW